ncbi:AraC family transcriptional regulator [Rhizobium sp. AB2/73]|uniref:AraC family transcriptional regulator n=1 Tax=Rhizobium sp. AB2/73 TaxID=2795216 RepID=UPI001C5F6EEE|nr:AraC family transcriptional regulator [Rhizobium sp. AB2/73]QYA12504.1 AraC family transcriptional regulator [Rhizobium sp. AB2/73]UEQ81565.1 AraC family transcriptional regulator [Rhizobium sp. AB2/73]
MSSALKDAITQFIEANDGGDNGVFPTGIDGLLIMRSTEPKMPHAMIYRPALCVILQGAKQLVLNERVIDYAEMQALIISIELPAAGRVIQASVEKPYIAISLEFDAGMMREVMEQLDKPPKPAGGTQLGIFVENLGDELADCLVRLTRLLSNPSAIPVLYPAIMREICFWMLTGPNGGEVCKLVLPDGQTRRIADAIRLLRDNFTEQVRIEQLAAVARMSPSSFHQHFKTLTSMTPLQYQKQMRLLEARRLMVAGHANVETAAYRVGYESASQFSREYTRMFGTPPKRDVTEMRMAAE